MIRVESAVATLWMRHLSFPCFVVPSFSRHAQELLRELSVDYRRFNLSTDHSTGQACYLPLELFDDTNFEAREPHDWVRVGSAHGAFARSLAD